MSDEVWRHGRKLVMREGAVLPDRCVKTNQPSPGIRLDVMVHWHHPALYLILLGNWLIYLIVAALLEKSAIVTVGISEAALNSHRRTVYVAWGLVWTGVGFFALSAMWLHTFAVALPGFIALAAALVVYLWRVRIVTAARIEDGYVWLYGVNPAYLDLLPEWPHD